MDIASLVTGSDQTDSDQKRHNLILKDNPEHQNHKLKSESVDNGSLEPRSSGYLDVESDKVTTPVSNEENIRSKCGNVDMKHVTGKSSGRSSRKGKQVCSKPSGRRYLLRSVGDGVRVLRSMSKEKYLTHTEPVSTTVNPEKERIQKKRRVKESANDEFSRNRKQLRYLLTRINYEQNLIDAYSGEGWKGQSSEKIRPEKELERAKSEILHRKLKIRNLFQHIDASVSEGGIQETLFDNEGQICSEDIYCANCGSTDLSSDNDIILCDGSCNRGFHQKCLNPPLLSEDIPPGDEGWLCPACDCKVDCIDLLNDLQGTNLSIDDNWEKVFPEAAITKNGDEQYDILGLPSDDSEDDDFDPDAPEVDVENQEERSTSGESDLISSPEDSDSSSSGCHKHSDTLGLPSEDSEDDDYDPDGPDPDEKVVKECSSSDESEFSSDSDEFMGELTKASVSLLSDKKPFGHSSVETCMNDGHKSSINSELLNLLESDLNQENSLPVSEKRQREILDYKKLHDETYGEVPSDSSDDDDWCNISESKKRKKDDTENESNLLLEAKARISVNRRTTRRSVSKSTEPNEVGKRDLDHHQDSQFGTQNTPERTRQKLDLSSTSNLIDAQPGDSLDPDSNEKKHNTSVINALDKMISQETYGEVSSDSNDDDDWRNISKSKKRKKDETENESNLLLEAKARIAVNKRTTRRSTVKSTEANEVGNRDLDLRQDSQFATQNTPERILQKLDISSANNLIDAPPGDSLDPDSNEKKPSTSVRKALDKMVSQKLLESFKGNQYPRREIKASLAEEFGITLEQVSKWFENARRRARIAANEADQLGLSTTDKSTTATSSKNHNQSYNGAGGNSTCNPKGRGDSGQAKHLKVGAEHNIGVGDAIKLVDNERQKAVARELRRMRKRR